MNTELTKRIVTLEYQCCANTQYSRKECLELVGLPHQVDDNQLKSTINFRESWFQIHPGFIAECHRLGKNNDSVIIKFSCMNDCKQVLLVKKVLNDISMGELDLARCTEIFIKQSLCPYYRILLSKGKRLHSLDIVNEFFASGGTAKFKTAENIRPFAIKLLSNIKFHFANVDLSPPSESSQFRLCYTLCLYQVYFIAESFFKV